MRCFKYLILALFLCAVFVPGTVYADPAVGIDDAEGLLKMAENPSGSYVLTHDVDLAGVDWTPFAFTGTLNGQGYAIRNLTVKKTGAETRETVDGNTKPYETVFAGLFSVLENASVRDLSLIGVTVSVEETVSGADGNPAGDNNSGVYVGALAGYAADSTVFGCRIAGTVSLRTNAKANGTGGVIGFAKASSVDSCRVNATLVLTDTDRDVPDENFLGGVYAAGYASVTDSSVSFDAYDSCHGYVHSGGLVGMYYPFGYAYDAAPTMSFTGNTVNGTIRFFEDSPSRRAYCEATIGEIMNWHIVRENNDTKGFRRDEVFAYDADLLPERGARAVSVNYTSFTDYPAGSELSVKAAGGSPIVGVYAVFWEEPGEYTVSMTGTLGPNVRESTLTVPADPEGGLQRYVTLGPGFGDPFELTVSFPESAKVCGIYPVLADDLGPDGSLPDWVHNWQDPCDSADVLLLSTHADDEQLFFAGILPYYAAVRKLDVQVAYLTDHMGELRRHQERLNGLWEVGVRHYPVSLHLPDAYSESYEAALASAVYAGYPEDALVNAVRETIERFRPKVIVGHDEAGEYGHGQHVLYTGLLERALADGWAEERPYIERVFLHLYGTDPVTLSFLDTPYDALDGKTPFQTTQDGFRHHESQQWTWFRGWLYGNGTPITKASEIATYSPLSYGRYYGNGKGYEAVRERGDLFAGLTSYAEDRAEAERLEQERLAAEAAEQRAEEERADAEEEARVHAEAARRERRTGTLLVVLSVLAVLGIAAIIIADRKRRA